MPPARTGSDEAVLFSTRSMAGFTKVGTMTLLLEGTVSVSVPETAALLVITPSANGITVIATVATPLLANVPRLQMTVPLLLMQVPWEEDEERKVTLAGKTFVTITLVAIEGPTFLIRSV